MLRSESYKKGLFLSTGFNIIARGVGFVNTLILAYYFGANASTDIYFLVLSVAMIITGIINGVDYYILIPEAMKLRERESEDSSRKFLNFFICLYACIGLLIASLVIVSPVFKIRFFGIAPE
jgi:putative peptidoglycan lipid II flippase